MGTGRSTQTNRIGQGNAGAMRAEEPAIRIQQKQQAEGTDLSTCRGRDDYLFQGCWERCEDIERWWRKRETRLTKPDGCWQKKGVATATKQARRCYAVNSSKTPFPNKWIIGTTSQIINSLIFTFPESALEKIWLARRGEGYGCRGSQNKSSKAFDSSIYNIRKLTLSSLIMLPFTDLKADWKTIRILQCSHSTRSESLNTQPPNRHFSSKRFPRWLIEPNNSTKMDVLRTQDSGGPSKYTGWEEKPRYKPSTLTLIWGSIGRRHSSQIKKWIRISRFRDWSSWVVAPLTFESPRMQYTIWLWIFLLRLLKSTSYDLTSSLFRSVIPYLSSASLDFLEFKSFAHLQFRLVK